LMEDWLIGFNGNGYWLSLKGGFHGGGGVLFDIGVGGDLNLTLGFVVFACEKSGVGNVWIVLFGFKRVGFSVFESKVHHTTVTSVVQP
jgi:hypothetical protein